MLDLPYTTLALRGPLRHALDCPIPLEPLPERPESIMFNLQTALTFAAAMKCPYGAAEPDVCELARSLTGCEDPDVLVAMVRVAALRTAMWHRHLGHVDSMSKRLFQNLTGQYDQLAARIRDYFEPPAIED